MAVDPKKNLEDIGFMIYELKNIYALTDDPKIDRSFTPKMKSKTRLESLQGWSKAIKKTLSL